MCTVVEDFAGRLRQRLAVFGKDLLPAFGRATDPAGPAVDHLLFGEQQPVCFQPVRCRVEGAGAIR